MMIIVSGCYTHRDKLQTQGLLPWKSLSGCFSLASSVLIHQNGFRGVNFIMKPLYRHIPDKGLLQNHDLSIIQCVQVESV